MRDVIRAVVFREGELSSHNSGVSPPAPVSSPVVETKTEPADDHGGQGGAHPQHPHAAESRAAQAAFEAQMKQFYNNPFASQLLAASSKMFSDFTPFLQSAAATVKVETPDEDTFEDADNERADNNDDNMNNSPVDLATNSSKSIDAIASKLVHTVETVNNEANRAVNKNILNCSEEIRKKMKTAGAESDVSSPSPGLVSACSQLRKSV